MESPETANEIKTIRFEIQSIRTTQELLVRDREDEIRVRLLKVLERNTLLGPIYLAVDGKRNQIQILSHLHSQGIKTSQPALSKWMNLLDEEGLIQKVAISGTSTIWGKKQEFEKVLKLSRYLSGGRARDRNK